MSVANILSRKKIKDSVKEILENNYVTRPPVNIIALVQNYDLQLKFAHFKDKRVCGFLDISDKSIWVNADDAPTRRNFTIAHEFGHWLLHKEAIECDPTSYKILFRQPLGGLKDYREIEANLFAGNLLVPTNMLKICRKAEFTPIQMATLFGVSEEVINYRLQQEGLDD